MENNHVTPRTFEGDLTRSVAQCVTLVMVKRRKGADDRLVFAAEIFSSTLSLASFFLHGALSEFSLSHAFQ